MHTVALEVTEMVAAHADRVTRPAATGADDPSTTRPSLLPFDPADLMTMRVKPADYARMCQVSRQTVSKWIKKGWITLGLDGLLDPVVASRQLLSKADPTRLRARVFKDATATLSELRARIQSLETEVAAEQGRAKYMIHHDELAARLCSLSEAIANEIDGLVDAHLNGLGADWIEIQIGAAIYLHDEATLREQWLDALDSRETNTPDSPFQGDNTP